MGGGGASDPGLVTIAYEELLKDVRDASLAERIERAFGDSPSALGIMAVTGVPGLPELRSRLLPMARQVAQLPPKELESVIDKESMYQVGWSHGVEKVEGGKFDTAKGSYYANPLTDNQVESLRARDGHADEELAKANPAFFAPNVWPSAELLPGFEQAFKDTAKLIHSTGRLVARHADHFVAQQLPGYRPGKLESVVADSLNCKARLLHYFPIAADKAPETGDLEFSDWCGWHNDHGSLTGLVPGMYLDAKGEEVPCPDAQAGLYIKSRNGRLVRVCLPPGSLAFQIGETSQIHTGGVLQATPHAVRGAAAPGISRESFAIFMEPEFSGDMDMPTDRTVEDTQKEEAQRFLPRTVRTLRSRWKQGQNFGEFSDATFSAFH
eukprot:Hpha_TRINITY_DN16958_c1_g2::TRINITY_DN16958_c1_g2_i1::g.55036::m.55036